MPDTYHTAGHRAGTATSSSTETGTTSKITRHRLNRGGNRQANWALSLIAVGRMAWHGPTRAYVERRTKEGKSKAEIIRCLKRHIARELYGVLVSRPAT
jgi:hypothetical protein